MTLSTDLARPIVSRSASLHCDQTLLPLGKELGELGPFDLSTLNLAGLQIDDVQLESDFAKSKPMTGRFAAGCMAGLQFGCC